MRGAILAGGASRRMGTDKVLVEIEGRPLAQWVADALLAGGASEVVLVGAAPETAAALGLEAVPDRWPGEGPLGGVASALLAPAAGPGGADGIVVIAGCDQVSISGDLVARLATALDDPGAVAAAVPMPGGGWHPFPAAWRTTAGEAIAGLIADGARRASAAFGSVPVVGVEADEEVLTDLDTPDDVRRWVAARRTPDGSAPE